MTLERAKQILGSSYTEEQVKDLVRIGLALSDLAIDSVYQKYAIDQQQPKDR